jgi:rhamnosyltransferase
MNKTADTSESQEKKYVTVFIPTYNGDKYITECIDSILQQDLPSGYALELLVIDSGSRDNTLSKLKAFGNKINLLEIPNSEFSHGGTRDKAARLAKGEYVLFLSQDATPMNKRWLINMLEPFFISDKVGCVFGRQIPRPDAAATIKREVATVFGGLGAPDSVVIHRHKSLVDGSETNTLNTFFSDVNSASRRTLLTGDVPFRHVNYAEDQALAEDMQNKGYLKAYSPQGAVWHSNEYTIVEYYKRKFDEYIGLQESIAEQFTPRRRSLLFGWIRPTIADYRFIRYDNDYTIKSKLLWLVKAPAYNVALQLGKYRATRYINDPSQRERVSLEAGRRKS